MRYIVIAALLVGLTTTVNADTLKTGSCRGISTSNGYKYVGTYCVDFRCSVERTVMFDSWCPYMI